MLQAAICTYKGCLENKGINSATQQQRLTLGAIRRLVNPFCKQTLYIGSSLHRAHFRNNKLLEYQIVCKVN